MDELDIYSELPRFRNGGKKITVPIRASFRLVTPNLRTYLRDAEISATYTKCIEALLSPQVLKSLSLTGEDGWAQASQKRKNGFPI